MSGVDGIRRGWVAEVGHWMVVHGTEKAKDGCDSTRNKKSQSSSNTDLFVKCLN